MSIRAANRERTREALVTSALELFHEHGYPNVTIQDIAKRAGVGRRTVFRYFPTKEDIVLFDHADYVAVFRRVLFEQRDQRHAPFDLLRAAAIAVAAELQENRTQLLPRLRLVQSVPALMARYVELDQRWHVAILEALGPPTRDTELRLRLFAGATMGALNAGLFVWVKRNGRVDLSATTKIVFRLLEQGLGGVIV
ncbi:MAG: TetR/AcrR family transcriptional regulator [Kofleriaceae bacterium]